MNADATATAGAARAPSTLCILLAEARYESLRALRTPSFAIPALSFPLLFYLLFGVLLNHGNARAGHYLLATYGVFAVIGPGLFAFGVGLAVDRERGLLTLKRAHPVPDAALLGARMLTALLFAALIVAMLLAAGATLGGVRMAPGRWLLLMAVDVAGVLPFCALGLLIGCRVGGSAAPGIVNLVYLPMALLSGLWLPLSMLPPVFAALAPLWPAWHLSQLALWASGQPSQGVPAVHAAAALGFAAVCWALAQRRLRRS